MDLIAAAGIAAVASIVGSLVTLRVTRRGNVVENRRIEANADTAANAQSTTDAEFVSTMALKLLAPYEARVQQLEADDAAKTLEIAMLKARVTLLEHTLRENKIDVPNGHDEIREV